MVKGDPYYGWEISPSNLYLQRKPRPGFPVTTYLHRLWGPVWLSRNTVSSPVIPGWSPWWPESRPTPEALCTCSAGWALGSRLIGRQAGKLPSVRANTVSQASAQTFSMSQSEGQGTGGQGGCHACAEWKGLKLTSTGHMSLFRMQGSTLCVCVHVCVYVRACMYMCKYMSCRENWPWIYFLCAGLRTVGSWASH